VICPCVHEAELELRIARNEVAFRAANESLRGVFADPGDEALEAYPFLCECGERVCTEVVQMPLEAYEEVREHPARFVIVPGHKRLASETVVDESDGYQVVEKAGRAGDIARAHWNQLTPNGS
jgi:hypothetical protein